MNQGWAAVSAVRSWPQGLHGTEGNGVTVKMRELGRTGVRVSPNCLGTTDCGEDSSSRRRIVTEVQLGATR